MNVQAVTMSVRVVARVRPLLKTEREIDVIVRTGSSAPSEYKSQQSTNDDRKLAALRDRDNVVRIPNPKNGGEEYTFQFSAVYDAEVAQQEMFDAEGECRLLSQLEKASSMANADQLQSHPPSSTSSTDSILQYSRMVSRALGKHTQCEVEKVSPIEVSFLGS